MKLHYFVLANSPALCGKSWEQSTNATRRAETCLTCERELAARQLARLRSA